jgi:hypothetical protein
MAGLVQMVIADDPEAAWPRIRPHLAYQWKTYAHYGALGQQGAGLVLRPDLDSATLGADPDQLRSKASVLVAPAFDVVTPEDAVRRLTEWMSDMPVQHVMMWASVSAMPDDLAVRHVELLSSKVAPALRDVGLPVDAR